MCKNPEMKEKASRCIFPATAAPHAPAPHSAGPSVMSACVHWGLQLAHQTHSSRESTPPLQSPSLAVRSLQRDRQLVRRGEVAFDVPGSAQASLFAHIKAEEI